MKKSITTGDPYANIVTVPSQPLDFLLMWSSTVGDADKDCLPSNTLIPELFKNYKFFLSTLEKTKTREEILAEVQNGEDEELGRIRMAPLPVLISLMTREPYLSDVHPVVTFWPLKNGDWGHCMYFQEKGCRYKKIGPAQEVYPKGTIIVSVELW